MPCIYMIADTRNGMRDSGEMIRLSNIKRSFKPVVKCNVNGLILERYNSIKEASDVNKINIRYAIKTGRLCNNFIWKNV